MLTHAVKLRDAWAARVVAPLTTSYLRRLRGNEAFKEFYETVVKESEEYTEEPILPQYKQSPRRLGAASAPHRFYSPECYYRFFYFQALDLISEQMKSTKVQTLGAYCVESCVLCKYACAEIGHALHCSFNAWCCRF